jgi:N-acetylmuramoyl-L-alanine amidase
VRVAAGGCEGLSYGASPFSSRLLFYFATSSSAPNRPRNRRILTPTSSQKLTLRCLAALRANTRNCANYLRPLRLIQRRLSSAPSAPAEIAPLDNALDPNLMTAAERLTEIGEILATGILRLRAKTQKAKDLRDLSLDFPAHQSRHGRNQRRRERP